MKSRTVYQIEIDGVVLQDEFVTHDDAEKKAREVLESDDVKLVEVFKVQYSDIMGIRKGKNYGK